MKKYLFVPWVIMTIIMTVVAIFIVPILLIIERIRDEKERRKSAKQGLGRNVLSRDEGGPP
jgi:uncharacterized membrane protein